MPFYDDQIDPIPQPVSTPLPAPPDPGWHKSSQPEPFAYSDQLELQQLDNAAARVRQKDGVENDATTTADLMGQIEAKRRPLQERQSETMAYLQRQAEQAAMRGNALAHSMQLENGAASAANLPRQVASWTDAATGTSAHFLPDAKGGYTQIDLGEPAPYVPGAEGSVEDTERPGGGPVVGPQPQPVTVASREATFDQLNRAEVAARAEWEQTRAVNPYTGRAERPDGDPEKLAAFQNLAKQREAAYQTWQRDKMHQPLEKEGVDPVGHYTKDGRPVGRDGRYMQTLEQQQGAANPAPPSPPAENDFYRQAERLVGPAPPQFIGVGPHGQPVVNPAHARWLGARQAMASDLAKEHRQTMREAEKRREEEFKAAQVEHKDRFDKNYMAHYAALQKELARVRKANAPTKDNQTPEQEPLPAWAADEDTMHAEAVRRALRQSVANPHGRTNPGPVAPGPAPARAAEPAQPKPAAQPEAKPLPAEKFTDAEIKAELKRRAQRLIPGTPEFHRAGGWGNPALQD